jgi:3alpha(or 20beta)-hydroxysteroid dehydrogenase
MSDAPATAAGIVLVTGAAQGMGAHHAQRLASSGWHVCVTDVRDVSGVVTRITDAGGKASGHHLDVTSPDSWHDVVQEVAATTGALHALVNNAGISRRRRFTDTDTDSWNSTLDVNLSGAFYGMKAVHALMASSGGGSIVNVSSISGMVGYFSPAYAASKWGLRGLSKSAAGEFASAGIRVNSIHPGLVDTPLLENSEKFVDASLRSVPLGRTATVDEISDLVCYLVSDASRYITGAEITIDGGLTASGLYHRITTDSEGDL